MFEFFGSIGLVMLYKVSFVREAFIQKQHATAIFFNLEKAYDTTWKFSILKDLHNAGLRGRLSLFIHSECQCSIMPYTSVLYYRTLSVRNLLPDISVTFLLYKVSHFASTLSVRRYTTLTSRFCRH